MHLRSEIKAKIKTILATAVSGVYPTTAEGRVYANKYAPSDDEEIPYILIWCISEDSEREDTIYSKRIAHIIIEAFSDGYDADDDLDTLTNAIETAMNNEPLLGGLCSSFELKKTDIGSDENADSTIQAARLQYDIVYYATYSADAPTDDFKTAQVDETNGKYSDTITLPTA